ncbi:hypothetical protein ACJMK2_031122 [Sinanodonta woodiana]|uniref:Death domain-containing protein n=1 Tax=Sinanodonta woodiana TaxID=1069815 RepID=A0ABD3WXU2_SINWO
MPAIKIFAMAIRYFKDHMLKELKIAGQGQTLNDIHWVLPVPTSWTDSVKNFLRKAANEAGIDGANLTIVLAPDAAAVYCEALPSDRLSCGGRFDDDKYMVLDLGDNKAVFTVHEKQPNGKIQEVHEASGGSWGSTRVDEEFTQMIINIVEDQTFKEFCDNSPVDLLNMRRELEIKKIIYSRNDNCCKIGIKVPVSLGTTYFKNNGKTVKDAVEQSPYKGKLIWMGDIIRIDAELFRSFFKNSISNITNHIENLCQKPGVKGIPTFLMIGKFSEFQIVQEAVIKAFPNSKVVLPKDGPDLAVVKGALLLGHKLGQICDYNFELQQRTNKDHSSVVSTFAKYDEDVYSDDCAKGSTCYSSYDLSDKEEDALSSDYVEMSMHRRAIGGLETQLETQMALEANTTRSPTDDELFALSRQLNKLDKQWWLLAKLLGLSDKQIHEIERGAGSKHIGRQYYTMLKVWRGQNAGQEKGSVRYLLRQLDEAGIDLKMTDTVFGN